jgi:hypothetical protein
MQVPPTPHTVSFHVGRGLCYEENAVYATKENTTTQLYLHVHVPPKR